MQESKSLLEFPLIQDRLSKLTHTEISLSMVGSLSFLPVDELSRELGMLSNSLDLIDRFGGFPIDASIDLKELLSYVNAGGILDLGQLEQVAYDCLTGYRLKDYFSKVEDRESPVREYAVGLPELSFLEKRIHEVVGPGPSVYDEASPALHSIRLKIKRLEQKSVNSLSSLSNKYKAYLNGTNFTLRNGHYCLPVKNDFKSKIRGVMQDISASGETIFIEPEELLLIYNEISSAKKEEEAEINRLLAVLSDAIRENSSDCLKQNRMIGYLDFLLAKANLARRENAHVAHIAERNEISIFGARHPLLDPNKAVPNDFLLTEKEPAIIISGPNAGGKTVALKTLGLLVYMHHCGLAIPAKEGAEITYLNNVYADIGDRQSLEENLSTFAAHISAIAKIIDEAGEGDLVLLDEIGTGTSPQEGEALAYACVKKLLDKGCFILATSHFNALKAYAMIEDRLVSASLVYDDENMRPTYILKRGLPGESYAFEVASRYGLGDDVIKEARQFVGNHHEEGELQSKKLLRLVLDEEKLKEELLNQKKELERQKAQLDSFQAQLKRKQEGLEEEMRKKEAKLLEKAKSEVEEAISILSKPDVKLHEAIQVKKNIEALEEEEGEELEDFDERDLSIGDYVYIPGYDLRGKIVKLNNREASIASSNGAVFKLDRSKLKRINPPKDEPKLSKVDRMLIRNVPLEINLIGQRADEAKYHLEGYLDECRLANIKRVRIIHGFGSGILKKMVWEYLKSHPEFVESYESGDQFEGGLGATIAHLK